MPRKYDLEFKLEAVRMASEQAVTGRVNTGPESLKRPSYFGAYLKGSKKRFHLLLEYQYQHLTFTG